MLGTSVAGGQGRARGKQRPQLFSGLLWERQSRGSRVNASFNNSSRLEGTGAVPSCLGLFGAGEIPASGTGSLIKEVLGVWTGTGRSVDEKWPHHQFTVYRNPLAL